MSTYRHPRQFHDAGGYLLDFQTVYNAPFDELKYYDGKEVFMEDVCGVVWIVPSEPRKGPRYSLYGYGPASESDVQTYLIDWHVYVIDLRTATVTAHRYFSCSAPDSVQGDAPRRTYMEPGGFAITRWLNRLSVIPSASQSDLSKAKYLRECRDIDYEVLQMNADRLAGRLCRFTGPVYWILDAGEGQYWNQFGHGLRPRTQILLAVRQDMGGRWGDYVMVLYHTAVNVHDNDFIRVWGECVGSYTYQSETGENAKLPLLRARYIQEQ